VALKILLADDNITAQKMGSKILTDAGNTVIAVSNGAAAMKKIVSEKPELIILDVYMPGYSGLEVCEKVKGAPETAKVPVLLTVTNMEPFNPEDGNRVKADGVLIKPFEATDLLAVVKKFEEKIRPSGPKTVKMEAVKDFEDDTYAEWKADAEPEEAAKPAQMSHEMASSPALGFEDFSSATEPMAGQEAASAPVIEVQAESAPTPTFDLNAPPPAFDLNAPAPAFDLAHAEPSGPAEMAIAPPPELEFNSAPPTAAIDVPPAAELEITAQESAADTPIVRDPALSTDPTDIIQFATKFGEEHPEDVPVGIAMPDPDHEEAIDAIPDLLAESSPSTPPTTEQTLPQAILQTSGGAAAAVAPALEAAPAEEAGIKTERLEVMAEPEPERITQPIPAMTEPDSGIAEMPPAEIPSAEHIEAHEAYQKHVEQQLVAQFAAELEAAQAEAPPEPEPLPEMEPPAEAATMIPAAEEQHVAEAVSRVLERYKGELIAAIVRELKS
jgi:CheY-like chemotaxis protein